MLHFLKMIVLSAGTWTTDAPPVRGARRVWGLLGKNEARPCGWLMPEVRNHVEEQPTNKWKQRLVDRERASRAPKGWSHAGPDA